MSAEALLARLEAEGVRLGLDTTRRLLADLDRPQSRLAVVLVAGTNGKGSTAALLAAMATAAGYRTGLFTSPHLEEVEERIRVDGHSIDSERLAAELEEVVRAAERGQGRLPTYFEALTAAALLHFVRRRVKLAVLEVGLGGRLDATNTTEPILSLIAEIAFDHEEYLGTDLRSIAREKAGILRRDRPAVAWCGGRSAGRELTRAAREIGAALVSGPDSCQVLSVERRVPAGQRVVLRTGAQEYELETRLSGRHQVGNLALATLGAEALGELGWTGLDRDAIARGAASCRWPGRLEGVEVPGCRAVLLDAAHNPSGALSLARHLEEEGGPYDLLFGVLGDKRVQQVLGPLAAGAERVFLTRPRSPRAAALETLEAALGAPADLAEPDPARALAAALAAGDSRLVVCGSLYLVGEARRELRRRFGMPAPAREPIFLE